MLPLKRGLFSLTDVFRKLLISNTYLQDVLSIMEKHHRDNFRSHASEIQWELSWTFFSFKERRRLLEKNSFTLWESVMTDEKYYLLFSPTQQAPK